jgi:hypothetical protein
MPDIVARSGGHQASGKKPVTGQGACRCAERCSVSRHLASLRNAGWVEDRRQGVWMCYRLFDDNEPCSGDLRVFFLILQSAHADN